MHANGVAGLQAIQSDSDRIENIDLTNIVSGNNYKYMHLKMLKSNFLWNHSFLYILYILINVNTFTSYLNIIYLNS